MELLKLWFHRANFGRVVDSEGELEKCVCKNWCCRYFDLMGVVEGCLFFSEMKSYLKWSLKIKYFAAHKETGAAEDLT